MCPPIHRGPCEEVQTTVEDKYIGRPFPPMACDSLVEGVSCTGCFNVNLLFETEWLKQPQHVEDTS